MTINSIVETLGKIADAILWFFKYKIQTDIPKRLDALKSEIKELENDITKYRNEISKTNNTEYANFCANICDELRIEFARKQRELKYLSDIYSKDSGSI